MTTLYFANSDGGIKGFPMLVSLPVVFPLRHSFILSPCKTRIGSNIPARKRALISFSHVLLSRRIKGSTTRIGLHGGPEVESPRSRSCSMHQAKYDKIGRVLPSPISSAKRLPLREGLSRWQVCNQARPSS